MRTADNMTWQRIAVVWVAMWMAVSLAAANMPRPGDDLGWVAQRDTRLGFSFDLPTRIFAALTDDPTAGLAERTERRSGSVFRSIDGRAHLQVAAFENVDAVSPQVLMRRIAEETYGDATITFSRLNEGFFILSGNRRGDEFYERVMFTCGGRLINVWQMTYPVRERALYDRVVEAVARTFRPATGGPDCR